MAGKGGHAKSPMNKPDDKARTQRAFGQTAATPSSSRSLLASVWKYGYGFDRKQQLDEKAKAQRAFGSTAMASTSSSLRPRLSELMEARLRPRPQPDNKASGSTATASTSGSSWTKRPRPSERPALFQAAAKQRQGPTSVWKYGCSTSSSNSQTTRQTPFVGRLRLLRASAGQQGKHPVNAWR